MKWEDCLHVLPVTIFGGDACATVHMLGCEHFVDYPQPLSLCQGHFDESANGLLDGLYLSDSMQPVSCSGPVDDVCKSLVVLCLDEDK